jgi:hypothetical protein
VNTIRTRIFLFLFLVTLFCSCSISGYYTSNPKSLGGGMAGYEIILTKNETFHIRKWSDNYSVYSDSLGNRLWRDTHYRGFGKFVQFGDSLELAFLNEDSISIEIFKITEELAFDYKVSITNESGKTYAPIVSVKDSTSKTIKTIFNKNEFYTEFQDSSNTKSKYIGFDFHMFESPEILIPLEELSLGRNMFKFKTYNGYYPRGTKINFYCKKAWSGIRYGTKRRWLAKKYKQKWLNKLYK